MRKTIEEKEAVIAEYLKGETTYRKLGEKLGIDYRTMHYWVRNFQGMQSKKQKNVKVQITKDDEALSCDVKQLQRELRKAKLHNKLLNAMIDIAEDQLKIDIRKKSGTKR